MSTEEKMAKRYEVSVEHVFDAPRSFVWALIADTNRWDRAQGLAPASYRWREEGGRREHVAQARELGFDIEWVEPPYEWVEGRHIRGSRRFLKGPIVSAGFTAYLTDEGKGTRVKATAFTASTHLLGAAIGQFMRVKQRAAMKRYFEGLGELVRQLPAEEKDESAVFTPAAVVARARLALAPYAELTAGPRSATDLGELSRRSARLSLAGLGGASVDRLMELLRDRPDEEIALIRPFELANVWKVDKREVLRLFLHATHAGLVDLKWQINCPVCRVGAAVADHMADIGRESHCDTCNIDYGVDLAKHVEAVFQCNAAIRRVDTKLYCASSPSFLPHVSAQLRTTPGKAVSERMDLATMMHMRTLEAKQVLDLELAALPAELYLTLSDDGLAARTEGVSDDGSTMVHIDSRASAPRTVLFERSGWSADVVLGHVVTSFPEFVHLFATEAPATGVELSVSHIALLFTDLTGSTACYERLGDARAFALVQQHFSEMEDCIGTAGGALIKTMGDAVMASFAAPAEAVRAAIAMIKANDDAGRSEGLGVKIGVHAGPCLAVRANERLDFFGTTANVAARMQAQAKSGELVLSLQLANDDAVAPLLVGRPLRHFQASLKGISAAVDLVGIQVGRAEREAS